MFREPFPILHVSEVERSVRFYRECFGFELRFRWPAEGPLEFAFLALGASGIGVASQSAPDLPDWPRERDLDSFQLCVYTDDADTASERLEGLGARRVTASREMPWGEKLVFFEDPDGNLLHVAARVGGPPDGDA